VPSSVGDLDRTTFPGPSQGPFERAETSAQSSVATTSEEEDRMIQIAVFQIHAAMCASLEAAGRTTLGA
jgi:hypothetical protein